MPFKDNILLLMPFNKHKAFQVFKQLVRGYYFQKYLISEHKNEFEAELSSLLSNASTFIVLSEVTNDCHVSWEHQHKSQL